LPFLPPLTVPARFFLLIHPLLLAHHHHFLQVFT